VAQPRGLTATDRAGGTFRLDEYMRGNLRADLVVQVATVGVFVVAVRSPWLVALWLVRWAVIAGIAGGLVLEGRGRRIPALWALIGGHCVGVLGSAAILPQVTPVTMLVLVGDLTLLVPYGARGASGPFLGMLVGTATAAGALSLQDWTGLAQTAPRWVVVTFICAHVVGTGFSVVVTTRAAESAMRTQAQRLADARARSTNAADAAARELRQRLNAGPARVIGVLEARLDDIAAALRTGQEARARELAEQATEQAQQCLRELREVSHGLFPDALANGGLAPAAAQLAQRTGAQLDLDLAPVRAHPSSENAVYSVLLAVLSTFPNPSTGHAVLTSHAAGPMLRFRVSVPGGLDSGAEASTAGEGLAEGLNPVLGDRFEAIGGRLEVAAGPGAWHADGEVPIDIDEVLAAQLVPDVVLDDSATLLTFTRLSAWFAGMGAAVCAGAYAITRLPVLVWVDVVLVLVAVCVTLAGRALRAARPSLASALLSAESSLAALFVTALVPEFSPVCVVIAVLPMVVTPPGVSPWVVRGTAVGQTITAFAATLLGLLGGVGAPLEGVPRWLVAAVLPPATAGVAGLVGATSATSLRRLRDLLGHAQQSSARLVVTADEHRRAIERDLHDGAQQGLVALSLQFRSLVIMVDRGLADRAADALVTLRATLGSARAELDELSRGVLPPRLAAGDLAGALTEAGDAAPVRVVVDADGSLPRRVSPEVATGVFYACFEAVQNAAKHAGDGVTVVVRLAHSAGDLVAEVTDDGPGVDPRRLSRGRGLSNIADRAAALGGRWSIDSRPGHGVRIRLVVPLGAGAGSEGPWPPGGG